MGYDVTIYEAKEKPGGLDTWGIAPYKMTQEDSFNEVKLVESFGVKIKTGVRAGKHVSFVDLEKSHDAIFIGVGLPRPTRLNIPGENMDGVVDALDFIDDVTTRRWKKVDVGKRVAIIGAGNTAIDAATEARRLGAEQVFMIYRRSEKEMPAYEFEFELAKKDGIQFYFQTAPKRIIGKKHVEALECIKMKLGKPDQDGRRKPEPLPRSNFKIAVDMVVKSVGQNTDDAFFGQITGLKLQDGNVIINSETYQTTNPKFFAGGDCINGGKEVVNASYDGKRAAHGIDKFLSNSG